MLLAVPSRITVDFTAPALLDKLLQELRRQDERTLVIFADCADAKAAYDKGVQFPMLNIGNMHYAPGKQQVCEHAAFSQEESVCLRAFSEMGVTLDFRCVPNDTTEVTDW
jgi:PTS system mannose-specific IIB component